MDVNICFLVVCQTMTITFKKCFVVGLGYITYKAYPCNYCHMKLFVHFVFVIIPTYVFSSLFMKYVTLSLLFIVVALLKVVNLSNTYYLLDLLFVSINRSPYQFWKRDKETSLFELRNYVISFKVITTLYLFFALDLVGCIRYIIIRSRLYEMWKKVLETVQLYCLHMYQLYCMKFNKSC